ncbi:hypothetical protein [Candidatus Nitrospira salsa]
MKSCPSRRPEGAQSRDQPIDPANIHVRAIGRVGNPAMKIAGIHPVKTLGASTTIKDVSPIRLILLSLSRNLTDWLDEYLNFPQLPLISIEISDF